MRLKLNKAAGLTRLKIPVGSDGEVVNLVLRRVDDMDLIGAMTPLLDLWASGWKPVVGRDLIGYARAERPSVLAWAELAIVEWDLLDEETGEDAPVTSDWIEALLAAHPAVYRALADGPFAEQSALALTRVAEKNVFAPSPNGTSAAAKPSAPAAPGAAPSARTAPTAH